MGYINSVVVPPNDYQRSEVSRIAWLTLDECIAKIRTYHLEKKQVIQNIDNVLQRYRLIS